MLLSCYTQSCYTQDVEKTGSHLMCLTEAILNPVGLSSRLSLLAKVVSLLVGLKMRIKPGYINNGQK